jgi:hypothetical protein
MAPSTQPPGVCVAPLRFASAAVPVRSPISQLSLPFSELVEQLTVL